MTAIHDLDRRVLVVDVSVQDKSGAREVSTAIMTPADYYEGVINKDISPEQKLQDLSAGLKKGVLGELEASRLAAEAIGWHVLSSEIREKVLQDFLLGVTRVDKGLFLSGLAIHPETALEMMDFLKHQVEFFKANFSAPRVLDMDAQLIDVAGMKQAGGMVGALGFLLEKIGKSEKLGKNTRNLVHLLVILSIFLTTCGVNDSSPVVPGLVVGDDNNSSEVDPTLQAAQEKALTAVADGSLQLTIEAADLQSTAEAGEMIATPEVVSAAESSSFEFGSTGHGETVGAEVVVDYTDAAKIIETLKIDMEMSGKDVSVIDWDKARVLAFELEGKDEQTGAADQHLVLVVLPKTEGGAIAFMAFEKDEAGDLIPVGKYDENTELVFMDWGEARGADKIQLGILKSTNEIDPVVMNFDLETGVVTLKIMFADGGEIELDVTNPDLMRAELEGKPGLLSLMGIPLPTQEMMADISQDGVRYNFDGQSWTIVNESGDTLWQFVQGEDQVWSWVKAESQQAELKAMPANPVSGDWYSTWNEAEQRVVKYVYYEIPEYWRWSLVTPLEGWVEVSSNLLMGLDGEPIPTGLYSQDEMQAMVDAGQIDPKIVEFAQTENDYQMDYYVGAVVIGFDDQHRPFCLIFDKSGHGYLSIIMETAPDLLSVVAMDNDGNINDQARQGFMLSANAKFTNSEKNIVEIGHLHEGNPQISLGNQLLIAFETEGEVNSLLFKGTGMALKPRSGELIGQLKQEISQGGSKIILPASSIVVSED